ncbi:MAG: ABC transporter substrate-binding protein, partial [Gemmatimonadota bacterium]
VAELEARRVLGIVGPVADDGLRTAATRRTSSDLVLVSPLARQADALGPNVYSLWFTTEDLERLARTIAEFGVRQMGARRVAVVFPGDAVGFTQYEAFAQEARLHGAEIVAAEPYALNATTYEAPLSRVDSVNPEAVYAVATDPRAVIQLAPQLAYYGLRGIQIFGDPNWVDPESVRILDPRFLNGTVVATYLDRFSPESRWSEFEDLFEARYRKSLGNNIIPALGYDAVSLLLRAVPAATRQPGILARSLRNGLPYRGATGVMQVRGGRIQRDAVVVEIRDRQVFRTYPHPIQRPPEPAPSDSVAPPPGRRRGP